MGVVACLFCASRSHSTMLLLSLHGGLVCCLRAVVDTNALPDLGNGQATVGQATVGQATVGQATVGQATVGQATVGKPRSGSHGRASHGREATVGKPRARQINCNQQPTTTINQHSRWLLLLLVRCSFVVCSVRFGSVSCLLLARSLSRSLVFIDLCVWSVVCGVWCVHFAVLAAACIY